MDNTYYIELKEMLTTYLSSQKLRKTDERYAIFEQICLFPSHFDICMLHGQLKQTNFRVSKATLYNTLDILLAADLIVKHPFTEKSAQYELKARAEAHFHLICLLCGSIREICNTSVNVDIKNMKISRFTPMSSILYIYGVCNKCKNKVQKNTKKGNSRQ